MSEFSFEQLQQMRVANIQSQFVNNEELQKGEQDELEKARHGFYSDTPYNRKLNRVGQEYGKAKQEKQPSGQRTKKTEETSGAGGKTVAEHAADTDSKVLQKVVDDPKAKPELKEAAKAELEKRGEGSSDKGGGEKKIQSQKGDKKYNELLNEMGNDSRWASTVEAITGLDFSDFSDDEEIISAVKENTSFEKLNNAYKKYSGKDFKYSEEENEESTKSSNKNQDELLDEMGENSKWASAVETMSGLDFSTFDTDDEIKAAVKKELSEEDLQSAYKDFSEGKQVKQKQKEPEYAEKLSPIKMKKSLVKDFVEKVGSHVGEESGRKAVFELYQKYSKNNPMKTDKFLEKLDQGTYYSMKGKDRFALQNYLKKRNEGFTHEEAEKYCKEVQDNIQNALKEFGMI